MITRETEFLNVKNDITFVNNFIFVDFDSNDFELLVLFDESFSLLSFVDDIAASELDNASNYF